VGSKTGPEVYEHMMVYTSSYFDFLRTVFYKESDDVPIASRKEGE
jgi:hypothetical protein